MTQKFPRGIEVLLKKAAVDVAFRGRLLENHREAAKELECFIYPLTYFEEELPLLDNIPCEQLELIINQMEVPKDYRDILLGNDLDVMFAYLYQQDMSDNCNNNETAICFGILPDILEP